MITDPQMPNIFSAQSLNDAEDELAIFGGQTRVLTRKTKRKFAGAATSVSSPETTSPSETTTNTPFSSPPFNLLPMPDVHPSLIEYLKHDSIRKSHMQPHPQTMSNSTNTSPSASSNSQQRGSDTRSGSGSPSTKEMGEMYNSFMGYLASKSISNTPTAPGIVPPSMRDYRPPTQSNDMPSRRNPNGNTTIQPSAINQWEQSTGTRSQQSRPRHDPSNTSSGISTSDANALNSWMALNPANAGLSTVSPNQYFSGMESSSANNMNVSTMMTSQQGGMGGGVGYTPRTDPTMAFQGYGVDPSYLGSNFLPGTTAPFAPSQNPMDPMVEMGLTSESGMDEGWLSFMRECGIMENGRNQI